MVEEGCQIMRTWARLGVTLEAEGRAVAMLDTLQTAIEQ
jgi:hypothetical protein